MARSQSGDHRDEIGTGTAHRAIVLEYAGDAIRSAVDGRRAVTCRGRKQTSGK